MRLWGELAQVLVIAKCRQCYSSFAMTKRATCGTNTHLYLSGVPICLACVRELMRHASRAKRPQSRGPEHRRPKHSIT